MSGERIDGGESVRCPQCANRLAVTFAGGWMIRHKGRELIATGVASIRCEKCGRAWTAAELTERSTPTPDAA